MLLASCTKINNLMTHRFCEFSTTWPCYQPGPRDGYSNPYLILLAFSCIHFVSDLASVEIFVGWNKGTKNQGSLFLWVGNFEKSVCMSRESVALIIAIYAGFLYICSYSPPLSCWLCFAGEDKKTGRFICGYLDCTENPYFWITVARWSFYVDCL